MNSTQVDVFEAANVAELNRHTVLDAIAVAGRDVGVSELCRLTTLSRPTVMAALNALCARRLLERSSTDLPGPRGGRPGYGYRIAANNHAVAAIILRRRSIEVAIADHAGQVLAETEHRVKSVNRMRDPIEKACDLLADLAKTLPEHVQIQVVVAGVLGIVRNQCELFRSGALSSLTGMALHDRLAERFGCPVFIENDANLAALAEARAIGGPITMVGLLLGPDLGCGIVINGHLHRGRHGAAGELTTATWAEAIVELQSEEEQRPTADLFCKAGTDEPEARALVERIGEKIANGLVTIIEVLDPNQIVVGGQAVSAGDALLAPMRVILREQLGWDPDISYSALAERTIREGAFALGNDYIRWHVFGVRRVA